MSDIDVDIVVIGAGPAGLAAAAEASEAASVLLVDANARLGGQFWRHGAQDDGPGAPAPCWHHGWSVYSGLAAAVREHEAAGRLRLALETQVLSIDREGGGGGERFTVHLARTAEAHGARGRQAAGVVRARRVVLAAGAVDRHLPVPGWTLPGVMAAGGIQAFIKVQEVVPGRRVLLAGTGPFLLAAAHSVRRAGGEVVAICEAASLGGWFPGGALGALVPSKGLEGAEYAGGLVRDRVPYLRRHVVTEIRGDGRAEAVAVARADAEGRPIPGEERVFEGVDLVGLGWGFTPQIELLVQLGAETRLDADGSLVGVVDADLASSVPGLHLAGEVTGVKGAIGAVADGRIAGRSAAGLRPRRRDRAARARHAAFGRQMHRAHPIPRGWEAWLEPGTIVCRCEEVACGEILSARDDLGIGDPRSLKGATRAGMGYCQGRICGLAAQCLALGPDAAPEERHGAAVDVARRPLTMPLELGALARRERPDDGASEGTA